MSLDCMSVHEDIMLDNVDILLELGLHRVIRELDRDLVFHRGPDRARDSGDTLNPMRVSPEVEA